MQDAYPGVRVTDVHICEEVKDMLFSEFQEGTKCRDNEYNHKVYVDLEILYMHSNLTKEDIYEYGKKLVDNSKTEQELELERRIHESIDEYRKQIRDLREELTMVKDFYEMETDVKEKMYWRDRVRAVKKDIKHRRTKIQELKWILA